VSRVPTGWLVCLALVGCRDESPAPAAEDTGTGAATTSGTSTSAATDTGTADDATDTATEPTFGLDFVELAVEDGLALTTEIRFVPGTMEFIALSKTGEVDHYRLDGDAANRLGGFTLPGVYSDLDCGLLSAAFDPDFERNRLLFLSTCTSQTHSAIVRVTFDPSDYGTIADSMAEIHAAGDDEAPKPWHNVGQIGFDAQGNLWALYGDKRVASNGQDASNDLSALIRIVPNREPDGSGHTPADNNPFADGRGGSPNVFAVGLRSPWRGTYDALGRWWFGDVGANGVEEIDLVTAPGDNFGWAAHEGPCEEDCAGVVQPVAWWAHEGTHPYQLDDPEVSPTNARVAYVGLQYSGQYGDRYEGELTGTVLFGDYCQGFVRGLSVNTAGEVAEDRHLGHLRLPTSWDEAPDGFIYVSTFGQCETAGLDESAPPPSRLYRVVPK